jgi:hypothetical protein
MQNLIKSTLISRHTDKDVKIIILAFIIYLKYKDEKYSIVMLQNALNASVIGNNKEGERELIEIIRTSQRHLIEAEKTEEAQSFSTSGHKPIPSPFKQSSVTTRHARGGGQRKKRKTKKRKTKKKKTKKK